MPRLILPTVALALVLAAPSSATDLEAQIDRFELWGGCKPVFLVVEGLSDDAKSIGLSRSRIETTVRSRLRGARMYTEEQGAPYVHVYTNVSVVGPAFSAGIVLQKWMKDEASGLGGVARTWNAKVTGTHGKDAGYILSTVGELTDKFIDEYLRVNESACGKSD